LHLLTAGYGTELPIQDICSCVAIGGKADLEQALLNSPIHNSVARSQAGWLM